MTIFYYFDVFYLRLPQIFQVQAKISLNTLGNTLGNTRQYSSVQVKTHNLIYSAENSNILNCCVS